MSSRLVVSIDSSTTACKAIAWDARGQPLAEGRASYPVIQPLRGWHEQNAEDWWAGACRALNDCLAQVQGSPDRRPCHYPPARDVCAGGRGRHPDSQRHHVERRTQPCPGCCPRAQLWARTAPADGQAAVDDGLDFEAALARRARASTRGADRPLSRRARVPGAPADRPLSDGTRQRRPAWRARHGAPRLGGRSHPRHRPAPGPICRPGRARRRHRVCFPMPLRPLPACPPACP